MLPARERLCSVTLFATFVARDFTPAGVVRARVDPLDGLSAYGAPPGVFVLIQSFKHSFKEYGVSAINTPGFFVTPGEPKFRFVPFFQFVKPFKKLFDSAPYHNQPAFVLV